MSSRPYADARKTAHEKLVRQRRLRHDPASASRTEYNQNHSGFVADLLEIIRTSKSMIKAYGQA